MYQVSVCRPDLMGEECRMSPHVCTMAMSGESRERLGEGRYMPNHNQALGVPWPAETLPQPGQRKPQVPQTMQYMSNSETEA